MTAVIRSQVVTGNHRCPVADHCTGPPERPDHRTPPAYAGGMWFLIIVALVIAGVVAWRMRVPLMAKILGQSEGRMDRQLNRRKH